MGGVRVDGPDACVVIGAACCEMTDVRGEQNSRHVSVMSLKGRYRNQRGEVTILDHAPNVNVALKREREEDTLA